MAEVLAVRHIAEVEAAHRRHDPKVHLERGDYRVEVSPPTPDHDAFSFEYTYDATHPGFARWLGDGMEFGVFVHLNGETMLIPGE